MKKKSSSAKMKSKSKVVKSAGTNDITSLILRDHQPLKKLIMTLKNAEIGIEKKRPLYNEFEQLLSQHAKAEEESLYVHMKEEDDLCLEGLEGDTEHAIADQLMAEIGEIKNDDDLWLAKVKVLAEVVEHHVKEEEKNVLKQVRKEFDEKERMEIGKEYLQQMDDLRVERTSKVKPSAQSDRPGYYV